MQTDFTDKQIELHEAAIRKLRLIKDAEFRGKIAQAERNIAMCERWKKLSVELQNKYGEELQKLIEPVMNKMENEYQQ